MTGPSESHLPNRAGPGLDDQVERLFELHSPAWIDRARMAVAERPLGMLGAYELLAEIGRGGQGEVYRAIQPGTGRRIALKRIAGLGLAPSDSLRARFAREVGAMTRLSHPSVVTVHAAEQVEGHTVLVMELVDGTPIDRWADTRWADARSAFRTILAAFAETCDGVAHAHSRGVIHRDIKPSNVLVTPLGKAKVLDFGIAKLLDEAQPTHATASVFVGTPGYAAPERTSPGKAEADTRSDVYSLGVLLFRILAGPNALVPRGPDATGGMRVSRRRNLPKECDWIIDRATRADPAERYQTVDSLARDIRALIAGEAVEAAPASVCYRMRKWIARNRYTALASAVVVVALVAATIVSVFAAETARSALSRELTALSSSKVAEHRAVQEASRQQQISALMQQVLGASGALGGGRPDITVREALDNVVKAKFPNPSERSELDPLVEAAARTAIGDTYLGIGLFEDAVTHLTVADAILSESDRANSDDHLRVRYLLGRTLRALSRPSEAEPVLRGVVQAFRTRGSAAWYELAEALSSLGVCLRWLNRVDEAEVCYREGMELYETVAGPDSLGVSTMALNISILRSRRGDHAQAVPLACRGVEIRDRAYVSAHPDRSGAYAILGAVLWAAGSQVEAEENFRRAIAMDREMSPLPSMGVAWRLADLARRLDSIGRLKEAIDLDLESLRTEVAVSGAKHPSALASRARVASLLRRSGRLDESESLCLAVAASELTPSAGAGSLLTELAETRVALGCLGDAERDFRRAWELQIPVAAEPLAARGALAIRIARFYEDLGDLATAAEWRRRATE